MVKGVRRMANKENEGNSRSGIANFKTRRHPRFSINLPIRYWRSDNPDGHFSHAVDVSEGGFKAYLPESIEKGQILRLNLFYAASSDKLTKIEPLVQVVWGDNRAGKDGFYRTGVKILDISSTDLDSLRSFLITL
jgi:hypothetical protein